MIKTDYTLYSMNLQLFGEEAAPITNTSIPQSSGSEGQTVIYGTQSTPQADAAAQPAVELSPEQRFEELINGEYKDAYAATFQKTFDKRFKDHKQIESKLGEINPIVDLLMEKYKVKSASELYAKIEGETIEELAYQSNMSPEQYKRVKQLERENQTFKQQQLTQEQEAQRNQQVNAWIQQEQSVQKMYPEFKLKDWVNNEQFAKLIQTGVTVQAAYEVCDIDNVKNAVVKQAKAATIDNIKAKGNRPKENANTSQQGFIVKNDVSKLTKEDRREIARRASRGDNISFN